MDAVALEGLFVNLSGMDADEYGSRMAMGLSIKECYSKNVDLFDSVIIYSGEGSVFNYQTIYQQLDAILGKEKQANNNEIKFDNKRLEIFCMKRVRSTDRLKILSICSGRQIPMKPA